MERDADRAAREYREFSSTLRQLPISPTLRFHSTQRTVWAQGVKRTLTDRQFRVLAYLITLGGRIASREEVLAAVWGDTRPRQGSRTVDMQVARIRERLSLPTVILTVRGRGYRFNAAIAVTESADGFNGW
ncbi:MAG: winged helix-turn-helix domain-containing protein [Bifidobacteriaceae bacterium]|nr:winged helix-turn-helix domain-containing protein [Bifidobacteriaceae bacterium]